MNLRVQAFLPTGQIEAQANVPTQPPNGVFFVPNPTKIVVTLGGHDSVTLTVNQAVELLRLLRSVVPG